MAENDLAMTMTLELPTVTNAVATPVTALVRGAVSQETVRGGVDTTLEATAVVPRLRGSVESVAYGAVTEEVQGGA